MPAERGESESWVSTTSTRRRCRRCTPAISCSRARKNPFRNPRVRSPKTGRILRRSAGSPLEVTRSQPPLAQRFASQYTGGHGPSGHHGANFPRSNEPVPAPLQAYISIYTFPYIITLRHLLRCSTVFGSNGPRAATTRAAPAIDTHQQTAHSPICTPARSVIARRQIWTFPRHREVLPLTRRR